MKRVRIWVDEEEVWYDGRIVVEWWLGKRPNKWLLPGDYKVIRQIGNSAEIEIEVPDDIGPEEDPLWAAWEWLHNKYGDRA